jgi:replicative DNA helicase
VIKKLVTPSFMVVSPREVPTNLQAEQALLGGLLAQNSAAVHVSGFLKPEHFADPINAAIYDAILVRVEDNRIADAVTLRSEFQNAGILDEVGGPGYLGQLLSAMVSPLMVPEYGRAIFEAWQRRELLDLGQDLARAVVGVEHGDNLPAIISRHQLAIEAISAGGGHDTARRNLSDMLDATELQIEQAMTHGGVTGLSVGMAELDEVMSGLDPGTLTVVGGRPGSGKSTLATNWIMHVARQNVPVLYFSLEMSEVLLGRRILAAEANISQTTLKSGRMTELDIGDMIAAKRRIKNLPIWLDFRRGVTAQQICSKARVAHAQHNLGLIVIDHLHLVKGETVDMRAGGPTLAVTQAVHAFQAMAGVLGVPVVLLAQLSRALESRDDKRPTLADLRQAGAIEEDADTVVFVHRPEMYLPKTAPEPVARATQQQRENALDAYHNSVRMLTGKAEIIFAKNRAGETKVVDMRFNGSIGTFTKWETDDGKW